MLGPYQNIVKVVKQIRSPDQEEDDEDEYRSREESCLQCFKVLEEIGRILHHVLVQHHAILVSYTVRVFEHSQGVLSGNL